VALSKLIRIIGEDNIVKKSYIYPQIIELENIHNH